MNTNLKIYNALVGCIAGIISFAYFTRVVLDIDVTVGGWAFPIWLSYIAILVSGCISFMSFRLARDKQKVGDQTR